MKRMFWALGVGTLGLFLAVAGFPQRQACAALEDTTPPTGTIVVNGNRSTVNSTHVTLTLAWSDGTGSGVTRMRFSDDGAHWTRWEPLAATAAHVLPAGDGHKTVRVQFLDRANNYSAVFSDYVLLDMTPPVGTIVINNGASTTSSLAVTLGLTWSDGAGSGVRRMRFSNNGAYWTAWMPPAAARAHTLPGAAEYNTVRVQFLDGAGNYSAVYKDFIRLLPRTVPNVVGLAQAAAETALRGAGFAVGAVTRAYSETVASGSVITQNPAVGVSASPGSAVALVISLGSSVTVPDVRGLTQVAAGAALTGASLVTGTVTQQCSNTVANGLVISQSPSAPGPAPLGTAVDLVISTGLCSVTVPDVVGLSQSAAEAALLAAELSVGSVTTECSNSVASGNVISQNPTAPGPALFGSSVNLVVSTGLCSVVVPDVVGLAQSAAEAAVLAAELSVGSVTTECSNTVAAGDVISQNPTAPGPALFGSSVNLVV
jgi:beta-lactam-binding protein with PASTA domain